MTTSNDQSPTRPQNSLAPLLPHQYVLLTTYRKSGEGVGTQVWFAQKDETAYVITPARTGKLKRIRNNGRATLAPCKGNGQVIGERIECTARILAEEEQAAANQALRAKYGLLYRIFTGFQKLRGVQSSFIAIQPVQS